MTNVEKHEKIKEERSYRVDSSAAPTVRRYVTNHRNGGSAATGEPDGRALGVILRLEDLRATPPNIERIRERVRQLNRHLAASGTPLRLRVV